MSRLFLQLRDICLDIAVPQPKNETITERGIPVPQMRISTCPLTFNRLKREVILHQIMTGQGDI